MADPVETFEIGTDTAAAIAALQFLTVAPTNPAKYPDTWATANARVNAVLIKSIQKALKQLVEITDGTRPVIKLKIGATGNFLTMGSGAPSGGTNGDFHLRTSDGTLHSKVGGTWGEVGADAGGISPIDTTGMVNVEGAWDFDGDLLDASGNGYDLVASGATARYALLDGKQAICCWSGIRLDEAAGPGNSPLLQITGELTVHCLAWLNASEAGAESYLFAFGGSGESLATNHLYAIKVLTTGVLQFFGEYGAGGTDTTGAFEASIPVGKWTLVTLTRDAAGTGIKLYLDGTLVASLTLANAAAGGTTAEIYLQDTQCYHGGLVVCADEQDAAAVLAVAQQVGVAA